MEKYRKANIIADVIDFTVDAAGAAKTAAERAEFAAEIAGYRADLAEQERIDGKPADPREKRRGYNGAA